MAGIVKQQSCQRVVGLLPYGGAMRPLGERFLPDCIKQRAIHNWRLLAGQDLILVFDLADIEVVAQQIVQRAATERDATARRARRELLDSCPDVAFFEVPYQFVDAAEFEVAPVDEPDPFGFVFDNGNLAVLHLIAEGQGTSDPETLPL